jgi:hypothetical protein
MRFAISFGHFSILNSEIFYQQSGDAKKPYLAQYSAVVSADAPVNASYTTIKDNMPIKNRLNPLRANFNAFLIGLILAIADNIIN